MFILGDFNINLSFRHFNQKYLLNPEWRQKLLTL